MEATEVPIFKVLEKEEDFEPCGLPDVYLRAALWGGLSAGKSKTAIGMASGLGEKIAVIDTTRGQCRYYRDVAEFSVMEVPDGSPTRLIAAIDKARGFDVLIIDTASSEWVGPGSVLEIVETMPPSKDKVSPWSIASPLHNRFFDTLLNFPGHVIATFQARHQFEVVDGQTLRSAVSPVWRDGTEYSFNFVSLLRRHDGASILTVEKSMFDTIPYPTVVNPGKELGARLRELLSR